MQHGELKDNEMDKIRDDIKSIVEEGKYALIAYMPRIPYTTANYNETKNNGIPRIVFPNRFYLRCDICNRNHSFAYREYHPCGQNYCNTDKVECQEGAYAI